MLRILTLLALLVCSCGDSDSFNKLNYQALPSIALKSLQYEFKDEVIQSVNFVYGSEIDAFLDAVEEQTKFHITAMALRTPLGNFVYMRQGFDLESCAFIGTLGEELYHLIQQDRVGYRFIPDYGVETYLNGYDHNKYEFQAKVVAEVVTRRCKDGE